MCHVKQAQTVKKTPQVSIVIPVYNREKFLVNCIESLLRQTFGDFEICIVDDGSTDGSPALCDALLRRDSRIRVAHKPNGGATSARRAGVEMATGTWITFVDSDDTMPADGLERLMRRATDATDIVVGSFSDKRRWLVGRCSPRKYRRLLIMGRFNIGATCAKLLRRSLFDGTTFDLPRDIVMGEDLLMNLRLAFASAKPVMRVYGKVYDYVQHEENITHVFRNTPDYEQRFHEERLRCIPERERAAYLPVTVARRLRMLRRIVRMWNAEADGDWRTTDFAKNLLREIKSLHYPLTWRDADILLPADGVPFAKKWAAWVAYRLAGRLSF